jgi:hypothetical protein
MIPLRVSVVVDAAIGRVDRTEPCKRLEGKFELVEGSGCACGIFAAEFQLLVAWAEKEARSIEQAERAPLILINSTSRGAPRRPPTMHLGLPAASLTTVDLG